MCVGYIEGVREWERDHGALSQLGLCHHKAVYMRADMMVLHSSRYRPNCSNSISNQRSCKFKLGMGLRWILIIYSSPSLR